MTKEEIQKRIEEIEKELYSLNLERDLYDVRQMAVKIFLNSNYGSQSMKATTFAGHPEYFSAAITSSSRIANILIGREQSKKVYKISGKEHKEIAYNNLNFLDAIAQSDTDSNYVSIEEVIIKKFGVDYEKTQSLERLIEFTLNYVEKIALPLVRETLDDVYAYTLNATKPEKLSEDVEIIADNFISIAPKMYFTRIFWSEGVTLSKPKLKVTGLSTVRANTPKFYRTELKNAMDILIDGDIPRVTEYIGKVKTETYNQKPEDISINVGVSSLDYDWDETLKKFRKWTGEKYLGAPVNSRACLIHNLYINTKKIDVKDIEPGDKISFLYMKVPNPLPSSSNVLGFKEPKIFNNGLDEYIDRETMFEKGFLTPIKLITDPLKWDITPKDEQIDIDEW